MIKKILIAIGGCLLISLFGLILIVINESTEWGYDMVNIGLWLGQFLGVVMIVKNGTIMGTLYWRIIVAFLVLMLFGAVLKILHYKYADQSLVLGSFGVGITYLVWFIVKKAKGHLDFLKLLWVLAAYLGGVLMGLHFLPTDFMFVVQGLFWILLLDFAWLHLRTSRSN